MILDGFGHSESVEGNAIYAAKTPNIDRIMSENPHTFIGASGMDVGLPDGQMGNSEVGHTNIGAGRIVYQELTRITKSIADGDFFNNEAFLGAIENCKKNDSALHLYGLLSDGGVHSHNTHLYALLRLAKQQGLSKVFVHCFTDGRDVPPSSAASFVQELESVMSSIGVGKIATVMGRYYAMDRDNRWERVSKAYDAMVNGVGPKFNSATELVTDSYKNGVTDEFIVPSICDKNGMIKSGDSIVFFNFRPDRAREITRVFVQPDFDGFERANKPDVHYVCLTQYDATIENVDIAFRPQSLKNTFGEYIASKGLSQLRIAETEKYAHVTFFFNGGVEAPYDNEDRALIASPKVATYDLQPEMSAYLVTDEVLKRIDSDNYDVIILNFANCDMVGHTGSFEAAVKAVEAVDDCVGKIVPAFLKKGGNIIITADHGNADKMFDADGSPFTAHTTNLVPFVVIGKEVDLRAGGVLADIAPSMLKLLGIEQPEEMTGESIVL